MRIQVVCRASLAEGLGHLFRARSFCRVGIARGHAIDLVSIFDPDLDDLKDAGSEPAWVCRRDGELLPLLVPAPDVRVFDLNNLDPMVFAAACQGPALTATLFPLFAHMAGVDLLFSRSPHEPSRARVRTVCGYEVAVVSGPDALVDAATYQRQLSEAALPVAVAIGGPRAAAHTVRVLTALMRMQQPLALQVHVGEGFTSHTDALVEAMRTDSPHQVVLTRSSRTTGTMLQRAALAIVTDGTLLFDALYGGIPAVVMAAEPWQSDIVAGLLERHVVLDGGSLLNHDLDHLTETVAAAYRNRLDLIAVQQRGQALVDGRGAERILNHLSDELAKRAS